jgi:hypothetical protein
MRGSAVFVLAAAFAVAVPAARGQALLTASRIGDLQAGGGFSYGDADFNQKIMGGTFYASYDIRPHYGVEVDFHQLNTRLSGSQLYERTYEVGGRYLPFKYGIGRMHPYARGMYGRGVLNFPHSEANLAYNMFVGGAGVDFNVKPWLNARVDVEYQRWLSGTLLPNGLTPVVGTAGVAYVFGSHKLKGRQWILSAPKPEKPGKAPKDAPSQRQLLPTPAPVQDQPAPPAQSQQPVANAPQAQ